MSSPPSDAAAKIKSLQEVTGPRGDAECAQILAAHNWDLNEAVSFLLAVSGEDEFHSRGAAEPQSPIVPTSDVNGAPPAVGLGSYSNLNNSSANLRSRAGGAGDQRLGLSGSAHGADRRLESLGGAERRLPVANSTASAGPTPRSNQEASGTSAGVERDWHPPSGSGVAPRPPRNPGSMSSLPPAAGGNRGRGQSLIARLISLPLWLVRGGLGAVVGALSLGLWAAGGMFSFFLARVGSLAFWASGGALGAPPGRGAPRRALTLPEAALFRQRFEADYGSVHPEFFPGTFQEALRRASEQFRFLFVYLHSPEHVDTPRFCHDTLCNHVFAQFVDDNFVMWGGDVRGSEGFQMSGRLRSSTFPFCAVLTSASSQRIHLLRQVEGPVGMVELMSILQKVLEDQGAMLVAARVEEEERQLNRRLREEQDAAYQAALLADQEKERNRQEAEKKRKEEEEAEQQRQREEEEQAAAAAKAAEEAKNAIEQRRKEAADALEPQPEKGPQITQVVIRLPGGERKERRFKSTSPVQALYDFIDSEALGTPSIPSMHYSLVSNYPRTVYGKSLRDRSLLEAGLHPQASLFVQPEDEDKDDSAKPAEKKEQEYRDPEAWAARTGKKEVRD